MKILSIDQALLHTAFAIFENDEYVSHYSWEIKRKDNSDEVCYETFYYKIEDAIVLERPDIVICEKMWLGFNAAVFGKLQELVGIIRAICINNKVPFEAIPIATYRSAIGVKNKKDAVTEFISKSFPDLKLNNNDESDAIALGLAYCAMLKERECND